MKKSIQHPLFQLTFLIFLWGPLYRATHLFVSRDGRIYATVAKNFARGLGTIESPFYTPYWFTPFYDHPSLGVFLQSFFFRLFGEAFWVEKLYCLSLYILGIVLTYLIWSPKQKSVLSFVWCMLGWLLIPLTSHVFNNNYLEAPTLIAATAASYLLIQHPSALATTVAGFFVVLACLINGPMGLYPLCIPLLAAICLRTHPKKAFIQQLILLCSFTFTLFCILSIFPALKLNLVHYYDTQILSTMTGTRGGDLSWISHLKVFPLFIKTFALPIILTLSFILYQCQLDPNKTITFFKTKLKDKAFAFFVLLMLASSLPVGISPRLADHYFALSIPFLLISMLKLVTPTFQTLSENYNIKTSLLLFAFNLLSIVFVFYSFGTPSKNRLDFEDLNKLKNHLRNHATITIKENLNLYDEMRDMTTLLARHSNIDLDYTNQHQYYLTKTNKKPSPQYDLVALKMNHYFLWQKED